MRLHVGDVAARLGVSRASVYQYRTPGRISRTRFPAPDGHDREGDWWEESTIEQWRASRPGPGYRTDRRTQTEGISA